MGNKKQDGFDSRRGSSSNPILLPEVIVYSKKPLPWYERALNGVAKFVNDEIFLNKDNIRVKNAQRHPKAMDAVQEGGNIAGAIAAAPLAAYTAVLTAPAVMPILKVAGQAMTPSTWIGGGMLAAGYLAPGWFLNGTDLAASAYYANEAGKDINKNGLTWRTGFNALMSLAPMTRETEAIEGVASTLRRPTLAVSSVVDDFRAARNAVSSPKAVVSKNSIVSNNNKGYGKWFVEHHYPESMRDIILLPSGLLQRHRIGVGSTIEDLVTIPFTPYEKNKGYSIDFDKYATNIRPYEKWLLDYFNSGFYARRLAKSGLLSLRDAVLLHNNEMLGKVKYYTDDIPNNIIARTVRYVPYKESFGTAITFNSNHGNQRIGYNVYHEGKHAVDINSPISNHNIELVKDGRDHLNTPYKDLSINNKKHIDYLLSVNPHDKTVEMSGLLQPAMIYMLLHKLTPQLLIDSDYRHRDKNFLYILKFFNRDYVEKLLGPTGILSTLPLIANDNK